MAIGTIIAMVAAGDISVIAAQHGRGHRAALRAGHARPLGWDERRRLGRGSMRCAKLRVRPAATTEPQPDAGVQQTRARAGFCDVAGCDVVESAVDMRVDSFKDGARSESRSDGAQESAALRHGRWTSPWEYPILAPSPRRWTKPYLDCETAAWEDQLAVVTGACRYFV